MSDLIIHQRTLGDKAARQLANTTKTPAQMAAITPRWLVHLLNWVPVESGTYRVNHVRILHPDGRRVIPSFDSGNARIHASELRAIPLFKQLDAGLLEEISRSLVIEQVAAGQSIINEGDKLQKLYVLARGKAEAVRIGEHGERLRDVLLAEGDYFGSEALLSESLRGSTVTARTSVLLLTLDRSRFHALIDKAPGLRTSLERLNDELGHGALRDGYGQAPIKVACGQRDEGDLPQTFIDYEDQPREHTLSMVSTVLDVHTRVSDLFSSPVDQVREQLRLTIEGVKERQESELINNADYGLLHNIAPSMRVHPRKGAPTPDDMDELISRVWKEPAFFLAHPRAIAAFGRECTKRGVPPATVTLFGSPFLTWRGIPIIPCDKLFVDGGSRPASASGQTNILLMRVGEKKQGVVGLFQPGLPGEQTPGLSVRFMGINRQAIASYLVSLYCSAAVLTQDALGVLENVEVGNYHDYP